MDKLRGAWVVVKIVAYIAERKIMQWRFIATST